MHILARPATPPSPGKLMIDERSCEINSPIIRSAQSTPRPDSQMSIESIAMPLQANADIYGDPQGIRFDIDGLDDSEDRRLILVLKKLNDRGSTTVLKLESLMEQVGRAVRSREYFLNGQFEPQTYDDDQTLSENVLALRNIGSRHRISLDNFIQKVNKDIKRLNVLNTDSNSNPDNATPKAELNQMKKDVATALAKVTTLANGSVFSSMDMQSRVTELEKNLTESLRQIKTISKSVAILKNGSDSPSTSNNGVPIGVNRFDERLLKLEEEVMAQQNRNLFADTLDSRMDLIQRDLVDLKKDLKLNLASSEMNTWLDSKMKAFIDTIPFLDRVRSEINNRLVVFQVVPRNMAQETRMLIIKVII